MGRGMRTELGMLLAWLAFPMIPVVLEESYYQISVNILGSSRAGPDPGDWSWPTWLVMLGPLLGYGFLAGSTVEVPDDVTGPKRGLRRVVARRAVWVASGPWAGFLLVVAGFLGWKYLSNWLPGSQAPTTGQQGETWYAIVFGWTLVGVFAYGWLWPAWAALRRAARIGRWRHALYQGIVTALAFVGSLFGSFWAITRLWRSFFFDSRIMPMIAMGFGLLLLSGCAGTITYGEMRRRELFHAMLLSWVFGVAMIWWSASRRRRRKSPPSHPDSAEPRSSRTPSSDDR
jgi:hypothetical protein